MKYKLQAQSMKQLKFGHEEPFYKIVHEFESSCLKDMLENIEQWLRGIGYHFDGNLGIVDDIPEQRD